MDIEGEGNEDTTILQNMSVYYRNFGSALAINESGQFAVLGGKQGLYVVDLDKPFDTPRTCNVVHQHGMWDVGTVQWNPHHSRASYIASTANTNTLIWNIDERFALQSSFKAHDRPVQDLSWSPEDENLLATCSADGNVHIWDTRAPRKAMRLTMLAVRAAVTQVKWNKVASHLLASANDGEVRIWDMRKEKQPLSRITAHMGKVTGIDWSYSKESDLVSCGQDKQIKCWDINNIRTPKRTFVLGYPVGRVRYTPFGEGIVSMAQRDDFSLRLWSFQDTTAPIHVFGGDMGHTDVVTAFDWRIVWKDGERHHQLVSWSKDQHLKLWRIEEQHILDCEPGEEAPSISAGSSLSHSSGPASLGRLLSPREETVRQMGGSSWTGLAQEFAQLKRSPIPGITIQKMDTIACVCEVVARIGDLVQELRITFPSAYPHSAPPSFHLFPHPSVPMRLRAKLKELLSETADVYVNLSRPCLDQCLLQLAGFLEKHNNAQAAKTRRGNAISPSESPLDGSSSSSSPSSSPFLARTRDNFIPSPRTYGACFAISSLVIFRSFGQGEGPATTPRSYADMKKASIVLSPSKSEADEAEQLEEERGAENFMEISKLYFYTEVVDLLPIKMDLRNSKATKNPPAPTQSNAVLVRDIEHLLPISRTLGDLYTLSGAGPGQAMILCHKNRDAAMRLGRRDLVQLWTLIAHMTEPSLFPACSNSQDRLASLPSPRPLPPSLTDGSPSPPRSLSQGNARPRRHTLSMLMLPGTPLVQRHDHHSDNGCVWAMHPFGRGLVSAIFRHYHSLGDVQTLAMLSAVLSLCTATRSTETEQASGDSRAYLGVQSPLPLRSKPRSGSLSIPPLSLGPSPNPPGVAATTSTPSSALPASGLGTSQSSLSTSFSALANGLSSSTASSSSFQPTATPSSFGAMMSAMLMAPHPDGDDLSSHSLLEPADSLLHDHYRRTYADILYRWGKLEKHAEVLKFIPDLAAIQESRSLQMMRFCPKCGKMKNKLHCTKCHSYLFNCAICHTMVKGLSSFCFTCGHGGHMNHMRVWFEEHTTCPTGCGCECLSHANCVNPANQLSNSTS